MFVNRIIAAMIVLSWALIALGDVPASAVGGDSEEKAIGAMADYANLTSLGIVSVVLIFIVMKMLPDLHQKIANIPTAQAEIFTKALSTVAETHTLAIQSIMERTDKREDVRDTRFIASLESSSKAMNGVAKSLALLQRHCKDKEPA